MNKRITALALSICLAFPFVPEAVLAQSATSPSTMQKALRVPYLSASVETMTETATVNATISATDTITVPSTDTASAPTTNTPTSSKPTVTQNDVTTLAKLFTDKFASGDYAAAVAMFSDKVKLQLPENALKQAWTSSVNRYGLFKKQSLPRKSKLGNYDVVLIRLEFAKGSFDMRVVFDGQKNIAGLQFVPAENQTPYKPPAYVRISSFTEKSVTIGKGAWALHGTLSVPGGKGPFPAVVLVHGSGPNDRDESIGPNKVFRDLAWGLATQGIAVLRYEKRTKEHSAEFAKIRNYNTKAETVDDAVAAVEVLRKSKGLKINKRRIFVIGHSLGGMLAPRIAKAAPQIKGMVVMAGPTRALEDIILDQSQYLLSLSSTDTAAQQKQLAPIKQSVSLIKSKRLSNKIPASQLLGLPASYWLDLRDYNPAKLAGSLKKPVLILQGERDYQVKMIDYKGWQKYLAGNRRATLKSYLKLNHLFMEGTGRSTPTEYDKVNHIPSYVIKDVANWLKKFK